MIHKISFYLRIALQNLVVHKARMTLALLGILFAVMSLVAFGNISNGMKKKIEAEIGRFGKNLIIVRAGQVFTAGRSARQFSESRTLRLKDAQLIKESVPGVAEVVPYCDASYTARYKENTLTVTVAGVPNKIFDIRNIDLAAGRSFTGTEEVKAEKKAVIGFKVYENFFSSEDPIGKNILIFRVPTEVVGVMQEKGADFAGQDQDMQVYVPINAFMRRYNNVDYIKGIYVQVQDGYSMAGMKTALRVFIRKIHNTGPGQKDDFSLFTMEDILRTQEEGIRLVSVLTIIASTVSFLIGGLGIFAIMLLSVSERKMEIGVRRVVGSKKRDIIIQFLSESLIVAVVGSVGGIIAGFIVTILVDLIGGFPMVVSMNIPLALFISMVIGILAGIYPAIEGTKYEPVKALYL
ncbi:MAG: ABC transporter permease [Syntrophorhabdaceae bacterium]|nr:ABC transporter permease [Syntrophorhabdaceae bacterium]MDD4194901.1 ABC transporter permease [Syntrophorhabdaceae bacterium]HOC45884.1 ABC transporter permease [Syntrophorhabdaceae bacterium]